MSKPREADDDFVMYLNSGDRGTHPLEPGVTTVRSAFRQELEIPLSLSPDWQVALFSMYYTRSFGNALLKSPDDFHCQVGYIIPLDTYYSTQSVQLSRHQRYTHVGKVLQELIQRLGLYVMPVLTGATTYHYGQMHMKPPPLAQFPLTPNWIIFAAIWWRPGCLPTIPYPSPIWISETTSTTPPAR